MRFLFILLVILSFGRVQAQSLQEILASAYENNSELKAAREELKATDEEIMQSLSRWLPSINLYKKRTNAQNSSTNRSGISDGVNISQNLFRGGADIAAFKAAQSMIEQGRAILTHKEQEILLSVVDVYMKILQAEEEYQIFQDRIEDSRKLFESAKKRFEAGDATRTDVAQAKASMAAAEANTISVGSNLEVLRAKFIQLTGIQATNFIEPEFNLDLPQTLDQVSEIAMKDNPGLILARNKKDQGSHEVNQILGQKLLPSIDLDYTIQDDRQNNGFTPYGTEVHGDVNRVASVTLKIPVFDGGASWSQYRKVKRNYQEKQYSLANVKNQTITAVTQAWREHESRRHVLAAQKEAVSSATIAYEGMQKEERAGLRSIGEVINARNDYFDSYKRLLDAKAEYIKSGYAVAAQIGRCTAEHLKLNVKLYDPLKNYNIIKLQLIGAYTPK